MSAVTDQNDVPKKRIAALDLGTNSFHAVIVDIYPDGTFRTIDTLKEMVELGRNGVGKPLSRDAINSGIEALRKFKILCDHQEVERILSFATSAIREAPNGGEFLQMAIDETGIKILAIPGKMEAKLIGQAVQHGMALNSKPVLIMDIGGGSTEFIMANQQDLFFLDSHKIGVSRMAADFVSTDPVSCQEIKRMEDHYRKVLAELPAVSKMYPAETLIGSSGTMQNIAMMIANRKGIHTELTLNEFEYSRDDFLELYQHFTGLDRQDRLNVRGLDKKRVDFIIPGLVLVNTVLDLLDIQQIKTSTQALREGIILRQIKRETNDLKMLADYPDTRKRSVYELLKKCNWHEEHSQHVTRLALRLFDELRPYHKMDDNDRELLEYASLMHDIGYYISHNKHHKHALYLIKHAELKGFNEDEIQVMAHVARYHRRSTPKQRHKYYKDLNPGTRKKIRKLSGFLRVADGLDRSHFQNVTDVRVEMNKKLNIRIITQTDPQVEIWGAMRKSELLEELFNKAVKITGVTEEPIKPGII
ncbi:MAG: Ppx/GppA phosphatase family protein [Balneolales bacterium]